MFTALVLTFIGVAWYRAHRTYEATRGVDSRVNRASLSWAFIGASVGSFFGVAGLGGAIAATVPAAVIAFIIARLLMRLRVQRSNPAPGAVPTPTSDHAPPSSHSTSYSEAI